MNQTKNKENIVLTGFGLFRNYTSNPSWQAIRLLNDKHFNDDYNIIKIEIPVVYDDVERVVTEIWSKYRPLLVIHCGVSCIARCIHLEKRAIRNVERYCKQDVKCCLPKCIAQGSIKSNNSEEINGKSADVNDDGQLEYLYTELNLEQLRDQFNREYYDGNVEIPAKISDFAGEFLCEYIYRCSLMKDAKRTLFIHVPETNRELSDEDLSRCLELILKLLIEQITNNNSTKTTNESPLNLNLIDDKLKTTKTELNISNAIDD